MRVHLRWEAYNLEALDTALADIAAGRVHLLAFNDHTPPILRKKPRIYNPAYPPRTPSGEKKGEPDPDSDSGIP